MQQRPILFSTPMIRAILEGRKTMTRREIKHFDFSINKFGNVNYEFKKRGTRNWTAGTNATINDLNTSFFGVIDWCPYGKVGDVLWVRETWLENKGNLPTDLGYVYKAELGAEELEYSKELNVKWKPSIFMPKEACRICLKITDVRVERLQDISEIDAKKEGVFYYGEESNDYKNYLYEHDENCDDWGVLTAKESFQSLWQKINGEDSWNSDPFVWVISFERLFIKD